jgi:hypothetical protein
MADPTPDQAAISKLQADVAAFLADARAKAKGGLTVAEFGSLTIELLRIAVSGLDAIPSDKAAKKAWALEMVAILFDSIAAAAVPMPLRLVWPIVGPIIRQLVLSAASGALEQVLQLSRAATPAAPTPVVPA